MGAGHGHKLHFHGHSWLHRAPAHRKLVALVLFMLTVVALPQGLWWGYAAAAAALLLVVLSTRVPISFLAPRMVVELPFVFFALLMPLVALGPRISVLGVQVSQAGLIAGGSLLCKATIGVLASLTFAATTEPDAMLRGLTRLRVPNLLVQIMSFMFRYTDSVTGDLQRMMVAMRSRGFNPRSPRHWPMLGKALGALFIRSYERGERIHLAMISRGYDGRLP